MNKKEANLRFRVGLSSLVFFLAGLLLPAESVLYSDSALPPESAAKGGPPPPIVFEPKKPTLSIPVREEVKILRAERRKKMPYLDKGFVKESIRPKTVKARQAFDEKEGKALKDLVDRALAVNVVAKASKERIALTKRRILVAMRELLPGGELNFELRHGSLSSDAFTGRDYRVKFRIPVFRGGILWNTLLQEKAQYRAAKKEYEGVLNQLVDEVSNAYFDFVRASEVYKDKKKLTEQGDKQLGLSRMKFHKGLTSEIEYLNVESMAGQIQYDVETAQQELELAKLQLERYLEVEDLDEVEVARLYDVDALIEKEKPSVTDDHSAAEGMKKELPLGKSLDEFIDLAYQHRPELEAEAYQLRAERLGVKIRRGVFLPRVDVTAEFGELGEAFTRLHKPYPPTNPEWHMALEVSDNFIGNKVKYTYDRDEKAPSVSQFLQGTGSRVIRKGMSMGFLDGLGDFAELKEAKVKKLEQIAELEKKEQEVIREVKEAYFDFQKAKIQVESSLKRTQYREKLVKLSEVRLAKAEIEISEYLQAQIDAADERGKLHRALADLFKAKSKLNRAVGIRGLLSMEERYGV